jgi:hypothetical protein
LEQLRIGVVERLDIGLAEVHACDKVAGWKLDRAPKSVSKNALSDTCQRWRGEAGARDVLATPARRQVGTYPPKSSVCHAFWYD